MPETTEERPVSTLLRRQKFFLPDGQQAILWRTLTISLTELAADAPVVIPWMHKA